MTVELTENPKIQEMGHRIVNKLMKVFEQKIAGKKFTQQEALTLVTGLSMSFTKALIYHSLKNHPIMGDFQGYRQFLTVIFNRVMTNLETEINLRNRNGQANIH